jgi:predicted P-loop ATPase
MGIGEDIMQNGRPPANEDVVYRLCQYLGDKFWYDNFLMRIMTTWLSDKPEPVTDDVIFKLTVFMQSKLAMPKMSKDKVRGGLEAYCVDHRRNMAQEWLHSLSWDGTPRLNVMLPIAFGTEDDDYHAAVGRCFMVGMCSRILNPGCQMDNMLVLEGPESTFKSTALKILGGDWFAEAHYPVTHTDFYQCLQGKMLVELSEMASLERTSVEKIKACISRRTDNYRRSYGMLAGDYPRQCVFTASTNRDDWNHSDTGARRFWRVKVGQINTQWLIDYREQLFAEAAHRAKMGECYWDVPLDKQKALMADAREYDTWEPRVLAYIGARDWSTIDSILENALNTPVELQTKENIARVRRILKTNNYFAKSTRTTNGIIRAWHKSRLLKGPEPISRADEGTLQETGPAFINED